MFILPIKPYKEKTKTMCNWKSIVDNLDGSNANELICK